MNNAGISRRRDYDLLRVLSMVAVVYLHTAAGALRQPEYPFRWQFSNLLGALGTVAVPIFFMLSGALLMGSKRTADPAFMLKHRLPKVLLPGLFWSVVVIAGTWYVGGGDGALDKLLHLPNTTVLVAYWFLYALVPMYLLSPLLKRMVDALEPRHWNYLMGLWLVATLGLRTLSGFVPPPWNAFFTENMTLGVSFLEGYLGYFLLGAWLERQTRRPSRRVLWAVFAAAWAVIALGTWWDMARTGIYGQRFLSYTNLFAAVLAVAAFLLARSYQGEKESGRFLTFLSGTSFGVYLVHPFVIKMVETLWFKLAGTPATGIAGQVAVWGLVLTSSVLGVVLLQSIKPLCYLVTGQKFSAACKESNLFALLRKKAKSS